MEDPVDDGSSVDSYDYLDAVEFHNHEFSDCRLSDEEVREFVTDANNNMTWHDLPPSQNPPIITMDSSKSLQWDLAKRELDHVRCSLRRLSGLTEDSEISEETIIMLCLGPESKTGRFLCDELGLGRRQYLQFMSTLFIQAAYGVSVTQLYHGRLSLLKEKTLMEMDDYVEIWKTISSKRSIPDTEVSTNRREKPLWECMEYIVNDFLTSISITGRRGKISVALDDDKIWMNLKNSSRDDLFNLKYTTHVKDNRKGIIAHTAVSSGANIPLGISFERSQDSTERCFWRLLDRMFGQDGTTNLRNVYIHSDRGYMLPSLVFKYLLQVGADVLGTVKRGAGWPFTFDQKLKPNDRRTLVNKKGASTLFLKWCPAGVKSVFASAFRNGSDRVATAISTIHNQHHWEAIVLHPAELRDYSEDFNSLRKKFFQFVHLPGLIEEEDEDASDVMEDLQTRVIEPQTLRQGELFQFFYFTSTLFCSKIAHKFTPCAPTSFVKKRHS